MGPTTLFDKSFLQSLSVDESVFFDFYFIPAISPLFYVETLADLEKRVCEGRTQEQEVGIIAQKTPEVEGTPMPHHAEIGFVNLMGEVIAMNGRIPVIGGKAVEVDGIGGVVQELTPEAEAFHRWKKQQFLDIERKFAKTWRQNLQSLNLAAIAVGMNAVGIDPKTCKNFAEAKALADSFVDGDHRKFDRMRLAGALLGVPRHLERALIERWSAYDYPRLREYALYAAHVVTVELFFQIALGAKLISTEDANNRTDIGYLFYVPFCRLFVSSDRLHQRCAPLFLRDDQAFVWGPDLKADLARINKDVLQLPEEEREKGLFKTVPRPPKQGLVRQLWDRSFPKKTLPRTKSPPISESRKNRQAGSDFKRFMEGRPLQDHEINFDFQNPPMLAQARNIHIRKGSHWQLPKGTEQQ
jgi:hypothetical protein